MEVGGTKTALNHHVRFSKLQEVIFKHANNNKKSGVAFPHVLDVFLDANGSTLRQIFNT